MISQLLAATIGVLSFVLPAEPNRFDPPAASGPEATTKTDDQPSSSSDHVTICNASQQTLFVGGASYATTSVAARVRGCSPFVVPPGWRISIPPLTSAKESRVFVALATVEEAPQGPMRISLSAVGASAGDVIIWGSLDPTRAQPESVAGFVSGTLRPAGAGVLGQADAMDAFTKLLERRTDRERQTAPGRPTRWRDGLIGTKSDGLIVAKAGPMTVRSGEALLAIDESGASYRWIPPGRYMRDQPDAPFTPAEEVQLTSGFWFARTELTKAQHAFWSGADTTVLEDPDLPQDTISWNQITALLDKLPSDRPERHALPTDAQWEYVAGSGKGARFGAKLPPESQGWVQTTANHRSHEVACLAPSDWGIFDLHGNLAEWCSDRWSPVRRGGVDPAGPKKGSQRVYRGGGFEHPAWRCAAQLRDAGMPDNAFEWLGVRFVIQIPNPAATGEPKK